MSKFEKECKIYTIRELVEGFQWNDESGNVTSMNGTLTIRPCYQRDFVFKPEQQESLITSIYDGIPIQSISIRRDPYGQLSIVDGQQRITSICLYVNGYASHNKVAFSERSKEEQELFLNYQICADIVDIYNIQDVLPWFEKINKERSALTVQELRNAQLLDSKWLRHAKQYFSKSRCEATRVGKNWVRTTSPTHQFILEKAFKWHAHKEKLEDPGKYKRKGCDIDIYMDSHRDDNNAADVISYFQTVIIWAKETFTALCSNIQKNVEWGYLYNIYKDKVSRMDLEELNKDIDTALCNPDIKPATRKNIYEYVLSGKVNEQLLSGRKFNEADIYAVYKEQKGICPIDKQEYQLDEMEADHKKPVGKGGLSIRSNLQLLSKPSNRRKSDKVKQSISKEKLKNY